MFSKHSLQTIVKKCSLIIAYCTIKTIVEFFA